MIAKLIIWAIALCYLAGALIHAMNMAGLSGFSWPSAPLKWQVLDIVYLALNLMVAAGLVLGWRAGISAFFAAATSQIVLYTAFRRWVLDVPPEFAPPANAGSALNGLVLFHGVAIALMVLALWLQRGAETPA